MKFRILKNFMPDMTGGSVFELPYDRFRDEGIKGLIYDIDNTLVMHGAPPNQRCVELFAKLKDMGFSVFILSNNGVDRVKSFADTVGADYLYKAHKPSKDGYLRACEKMGIGADEAAAVGDQIFTDIWGARRSGIRAVMVDPIDSREEIQIKLKRLLEKPIIAAYRKRGTLDSTVTHL